MTGRSIAVLLLLSVPGYNMCMNATSLRDRFLNQIVHDHQWLQLLDLVPNVPFLLKDRKGRFMALNQTCCEYCGFSTQDDAIGKTDHDCFPKHLADAYVADDQVCIDTGQPVLNRLENAPRQRGSPYLVVTNKLPLFDKGGRVIGVAVCSRWIDQLQNPTCLEERLAQVFHFLHAEYANPINTKQLAKMASLSISQFNRRFSHAFGTTPSQYLLRIRIEEACRLLVGTNHTVSAIAHGTGFHDHAHLSRSFYRLMNVSPSQYRKTQGLFPST